ncbi:DUF7507 domain-containing protein, partial [Algoriphagus taiwanensis]
AVNQTDVDNGSVVNTATATGTAPNQSAQTATASATVTAIQTPGIALTKTANPGNFNELGDLITYTLIVENTGNETLSGILLTDPLTQLNQQLGTLMPGSTSTVNTTYTINQADIDQNFVLNIATVTGVSSSGSQVSDVAEAFVQGTVGGVVRSKLELTKTANPDTYEKVGDLITYTFVIQNTGITTLRDVILEDPMLSISSNLGIFSPNQSQTLSAVYTVTQQDVDAKQIENIATATGSGPSLELVLARDTAIVNLDLSALRPEISITKSADKSSVESEGEVITYTLEVQNTGVVDLINVQITDPLTGLDSLLGDLKVGESVSLNTVYTVTWDDILAQVPITNIATVTGIDSQNQSVEDTDSAEVRVVCANSTLLTGRVINLVDNLGLANVPLIITYPDNSQRLTLTDADGRYFLRNIPTGAYRIEVFDRNLNKAQNLFAVNGNTAEVTIATCRYVNQDFEYNLGTEANGLLHIQGFVWYDLNGDAEQNEWYDANGDDQVTQNPVSPGLSIDLNQWEWIDLNGDGSFEGLENFGELNKAGFGNPSGANLEIQGPNGYQATESIGAFGFWKHLLPPNQPLGEFTITLNPDDQFAQNGLSLVSTGLVKILPNQGGRVQEPRFKVVCEFTTPQVQTKIFESQSIVDFDYGITCRQQSDKEIIANDDLFGPISVSFGGTLGNILANDLLDGERPLPQDVLIQITDLGGMLGVSVDEEGNLVIIPGLNAPGTYQITYSLQEADFPENEDPAIITIIIENDQVDLSILKDRLSDEIYEGDEFEYQLTITNVGETPATEVVITDILPSGLTYISSNVLNVSSPQIQVGNPQVNGDTVTWSVPFVPSGGQIVLRIKVKAGDPGQILNIARVESEEEDINPLDNQAENLGEILPFRIPNVITPSTVDGDNDTFEILGLGKFISNEIVIFNRYGDHVLEATDYQNDWSASGQVAGTYFYVLKAVDKEGRTHEFKGWIQVIK